MKKDKPKRQMTQLYRDTWRRALDGCDSARYVGHGYFRFVSISLSCCRRGRQDQMNYA